jgi:hypothetical protein
VRLEVARITDASSVALVSAPVLVRLMKARAPNLAKRVIGAASKPSLEELADALQTVGPPDEADGFLEDLHLIARISLADTAEDLLIDRGVSLVQISLGDALANLALSDRALFDSIADHATVTAAAKGATFTLFEPRAARSVFELTANHTSGIETACAKFFDGLGQGSHCDVRYYVEHDETGFLIDHAGARRTERLINERDKPEVRQFRPFRHDVVLLQRGTGRLRILARSEKERLFYAQMVGEVLAKRTDFFAPAETYVLDAIATPNYGAVLSDLVDGEIERVALRELRFVAEDDFSTRQIVSSADVLGSLKANDTNLDPCILQQASFTIVPRVRKGRRCFRVTIWKGNKMKHDAPWSERTVQEILGRLRLRRDVP